MATVSNVTYPTSPIGYLTMDMVAGTFFPLGGARWDVRVTLDSAGADRIVVYENGAFTPKFQTFSTATGAGTSGDPLHFRIRPTPSWEGFKQYSVIATATDTGGDPVTPNEMMEPAGYEDRVPLRLFATQLGVMADNLIANPSERTSVEWSRIEVHQLVAGPGIANELTMYDANRAKFLSLSPPIRVIPGFRVHPSGAHSLWTDISYWTTLAAQAATFFAGRRASDDPTINLDIESYGDEVEPCDALGDNYAAFCTASQPFFDMLSALNPRPIGVMYPIVFFDLPNMHHFARRFVEIFGRDRTHFVTESPGNTWDLTELHRVKTSTSWAQLCQFCAQQRNTLEDTLGGPCKMRSFGDADLLRIWSQLATPAELKALGRMMPQIYDNTRVTLNGVSDRSLWGTPEARYGTTMSPANECQYAWAWPPMQQAAVYSVGKGTSTLNKAFRGSSSSQAVGAISTTDNIYGLKLHPNGADTVAFIQCDGVMPTTTPQAWTLSCSFQVPAGLVADTTLFGQDKVNVNSWHVYWRASDSALVWERNGQTQVLGTGYSPNTTINFAIARNGNTDWAWSINGVAAQHFTAGTNLAPQDHIQFGGGKIPGNPGLGSPGFMMSCVDFVAMHLKIAHTVASDATLAILSAGHYPYARLTPV